MTRIRDFVATAVDITKCWLCGDPAITTERSLLGFKVGLCGIHTGRAKG
jgi:hypothetical protein